ncbi:ribosome-associated translation inhibitor RaiA [Thiomicrorhabdus sp. 6S2-11]|uniref:Ribosome hibernation promoting factor n=1 Tax=Thiomicrorhabdus marina TaxID=2818442 RepID=A0ABS3Q2B1_9GAMM|nr:ribosome-associated translation inhibitor RaiA [Thiomicrorhabdus marina]MBO1926298.1 ribosome-associated translation inhibitor RaiA [Thiomicrorhabdus marina]
MQVNITGHHIDVTDALRSYVSEKLQKLERHFDHVTNVHVILTVNKQAQIAEATVHVSGADLFAQQESENMYASIDGLVDKLDRQIIKHKEKIGNHQKKSGGVKNMAAAEA